MNEKVKKKRAASPISRPDQNLNRQIPLAKKYVISYTVKKLLLKQLYMCVVAVALFIVVFVLCKIFPDVENGVKAVLHKNADLKKVLSLFTQIAKEVTIGE